MLQLYALLLVWDDTSSGISHFFRFVSIAISALSLSYATTGLVAEQPLYELRDKLQSGDEGGEGGGGWFTGLLFGTVPASGKVSLCAIDMHPQHVVWVFLLYEVFEVVSRFFSLALLALVLREWFFVVLLYLWLSRMLLLKASGELHMRSQLRLVGMPFMDSVLDNSCAFKFALLITLVEFVACVLISKFVSDGEDVILPDEPRQIISTVAIVCMVGKLVMAFSFVAPFKSLVQESHGGPTTSPTPLDGPVVAGKETAVQREHNFLEDVEPDANGGDEIDVDGYNEERIDIVAVE
ncbi:unnamed protein product [Choristocarpus tenellus]